jgi:hypothetical protein
VATHVLVKDGKSTRGDGGGSSSGGGGAHTPPTPRPPTPTPTVTRPPPPPTLPRPPPPRCTAWPARLPQSDRGRCTRPAPCPAPRWPLTV